MFLSLIVQAFLQVYHLWCFATIHLHVSNLIACDYSVRNEVIN
jgi:hypothetical protein